MTKQEFYDQRKWLDIHQQADDFIATKDGKTVMLAIYKSPDKRTSEDQQDFIEMLREWASSLTSNED